MTGRRPRGSPGRYRHRARSARGGRSSDGAPGHGVQARKGRRTCGSGRRRARPPGRGPGRECGGRAGQADPGTRYAGIPARSIAAPDPAPAGRSEPHTTGTPPRAAAAVPGGPSAARPGVDGTPPSDTGPSSTAGADRSPVARSRYRMSRTRPPSRDRVWPAGHALRGGDTDYVAIRTFGTARARLAARGGRRFVRFATPYPVCPSAFVRVCPICRGLRHGGVLLRSRCNGVGGVGCGCGVGWRGLGGLAVSRWGGVGPPFELCLGGVCRDPVVAGAA